MWVVSVDDRFTKDVVVYRGKDCVGKFIEAIFCEYEYCKGVVRDYFNKNLVISVEEEEAFQRAKNCWICRKLFDLIDEKVRDHCHVGGRFRGAAHFSCNANFKISKKVPVIFHNLKGYDGHLIMKELSNFDVVIDVIPNGSEKYMAFTINRNLVFIDNMQFMNASIDSLVGNLVNDDFKYLSKEFEDECFKLVKERGVSVDCFGRPVDYELDDECFELIKKKGAYPYEYVHSFERFRW